MRVLFYCLLAGLTTASPVKPFRRPSFRSGRQEAQTDSYGPPAEQATQASGPYPPSGWAPNGDLLLVPGETHSSQKNGVDSTFGTPSSQYGPPPLTTTSTTTEPAPIPDPDSTSDVQPSRPDSEGGQYFVLLPNGQLQKVRYSGKKKGRGQYEAQVEYEVVNPIQSPVYAYQGLPVTYAS